MQTQTQMQTQMQTQGAVVASPRTIPAAARVHPDRPSPVQEDYTESSCISESMHRPCQGSDRDTDHGEADEGSDGGSIQGCLLEAVMGVLDRLILRDDEFRRGCSVDRADRLSLARPARCLRRLERCLPPVQPLESQGRLGTHLRGNVGRSGFRVSRRLPPSSRSHRRLARQTRHGRRGL